MSNRRYTALDPEPHGTVELIRYYLHDVPDTVAGRDVRRYGRRMMRRLSSGCVICRFANKTRSRRRRMHAAYGRRAR